MQDKQKSFVFYICSECGHISEEETPHPDRTHEEFFWCEGEVVKMGAVPFDEDSMDSLMDYYESRMNQRAEALAKQLSAPKTLSDAAAATQYQLDQLTEYKNAMHKAVYGGSSLPPSIPIPPKPINIGNIGQSYHINGRLVSEIEYKTWEHNQRRIERKSEELERELTERAEKPKRSKGWFRSKT